MDFKKESILYLILLLSLLTSFVAHGIGVGKGTEGAIKDVVDPSKIEGVTPTPDGGYNLEGEIGRHKVINPTDTSITPLKTKSGMITNARLENYGTDFGDLIHGKITSLTDNNPISFKSMLDPDTRIEITLIKDGWAKVEQYDKYGNLISSTIVELSAGNVLNEVSNEFGDVFRFEPNNDTDKAVYERLEGKAKIESGTLTFDKNGKIEKVTALTKATQPTEIRLNKQTGFECVTLQQDGTYSFESSEKSFSVTNDNKQDYTVCINKKEKPVSKPVSQRSGYVDQVKDVIDLKNQVTYKHDNKLVYQGFDENNQAVIDLKKSSIVINNRAPGEKISEVRIGHHLVTEKRVSGEVRRYYKHVENPSPFLIRFYETSFNKIGIVAKDEALIQENPETSSKFIMHEPNSMEMGLCLGGMEEVLSYEKERSENC